jgi:hypothetical protein
MLIESDLERMVMLDMYYPNKDNITYEEWEHMFYKDLTSRKSYVNNFWYNKLDGENHAVRWK